MTDLWYGTSGPHDAPVVLVGESWGSREATTKRPFQGESGIELDRMLSRAGLRRDEILCTNVVADQPPSNEMWRFFVPRAAKPSLRIGGLAPTPQTVAECLRLYRQIIAHPRRLVIAAGNYALWALTESCTGSKIASRDSRGRDIPLDLRTWVPNGIMSWRGSMWQIEPRAEFLSGDTAERKRLAKIRLLPVVHPAAIQRAWYLRETFIHDIKTRVPQAIADDWRPLEPSFLAPPTFSEAIGILEWWLRRANAGGRFRLAADIETARGLITCIGFADSAEFAMSIPLIRRVGESDFDSFWSPDEEAELTRLIRNVLSHPNILLIGQNFLYDTQYIQHWFGVTPHLWHDTMLCQNTLFPGTPKALEYLASLYCRYYWYWKEDHKEWDMQGTIEDLLRYNCMDCIRTWEISESQNTLVDHLEMRSQMDLKMATNHLCLRMMNRGVLVDRKKRSQLSLEMGSALTDLHRELLEIVPQELIGEPGRRKDGSSIFWYTSDKQCKTLFYDILGFRLVRDPKTGQPTTGKKALMQFKLWYPEFNGLLDRCMLAASVENTVHVLQAGIEHDGRMRCSYNPGTVETHRLSSSENVFGRGTNMQNLTKGEEDE